MDFRHAWECAYRSDPPGSEVTINMRGNIELSRYGELNHVGLLLKGRNGWPDVNYGVSLKVRKDPSLTSTERVVLSRSSSASDEFSLIFVRASCDEVTNKCRDADTISFINKPPKLTLEYIELRGGRLGVGTQPPNSLGLRAAGIQVLAAKMYLTGCLITVGFV